MSTNRTYMIIPTTSTGSIDFTQVKETSEHTLRLNVSGSKTFVKWDGETIPTSVASLTTKEGPYTYDEIRNILTGSEWVEDIGEI